MAARTRRSTRSQSMETASSAVEDESAEEEEEEEEEEEGDITKPTSPRRRRRSSGTAEAIRPVSSSSTTRAFRGPRTARKSSGALYPVPSQQQQQHDGSATTPQPRRTRRGAVNGGNNNSNSSAVRSRNVAIKGRRGRRASSSTTMTRSTSSSSSAHAITSAVGAEAPQQPREDAAKLRQTAGGDEDSDSQTIVVVTSASASSSKNILQDTHGHPLAQAEDEPLPANTEVSEGPDEDEVATPRAKSRLRTVEQLAAFAKAGLARLLDKSTLELTDEELSMLRDFKNALEAYDVAKAAQFRDAPSSYVPFYLDLDSVQNSSAARLVNLFCFHSALLLSITNGFDEQALASLMLAEDGFLTHLCPTSIRTEPQTLDLFVQLKRQIIIRFRRMKDAELEAVALDSAVDPQDGDDDDAPTGLSIGDQEAYFEVLPNELLGCFGGDGPDAEFAIEDLREMCVRAWYQIEDNPVEFLEAVYPYEAFVQQAVEFIWRSYRTYTIADDGTVVSNEEEPAEEEREVVPEHSLQSVGTYAETDEQAEAGDEGDGNGDGDGEAKVYADAAIFADDRSDSYLRSDSDMDERASNHKGKAERQSADRLYRLRMSSERFGKQNDEIADRSIRAASGGTPQTRRLQEKLHSLSSSPSKNGRRSSSQNGGSQNLSLGAAALSSPSEAFRQEDLGEGPSRTRQEMLATSIGLPSSSMDILESAVQKMRQQEEEESESEQEIEVEMDDILAQSPAPYADEQEEDDGSILQGEDDAATPLEDPGDDTVIQINALSVELEYDEADSQVAATQLETQWETQDVEDALAETQQLLQEIGAPPIGAKGFYGSESVNSTLPAIENGAAKPALALKIGRDNRIVAATAQKASSLLDRQADAVRITMSSPSTPRLDLPDGRAPRRKSATPVVEIIQRRRSDSAGRENARAAKKASAAAAAAELLPSQQQQAEGLQPAIELDFDGGGDDYPVPEQDDLDYEPVQDDDDEEQEQDPELELELDEVPLPQPGGSSRRSSARVTRTYKSKQKRTAPWADSRSKSSKDVFLATEESDEDTVTTERHGRSTQQNGKSARLRSNQATEPDSPGMLRRSPRSRSSPDKNVDDDDDELPMLPTMAKRKGKIHPEEDDPEHAAQIERITQPLSEQVVKKRARKAAAGASKVYEYIPDSQDEDENFDTSSKSQANAVHNDNQDAEEEDEEDDRHDPTPGPSSRPHTIIKQSSSVLRGSRSRADSEFDELESDSVHSEHEDDTDYDSFDAQTIARQTLSSPARKGKAAPRSGTKSSDKNKITNDATRRYGAGDPRGKKRARSPSVERGRVRQMRRRDDDPRRSDSPKEVYRYGKKGAPRMYFTQEEDRCLLDALAELDNPLGFGRWGQILIWHGKNGTKSNILAQRSNVNLKDRAKTIQRNRDAQGMATLPWYAETARTASGDIAVRRKRGPNSAREKKQRAPQDRAGATHSSTTQRPIRAAASSSRIIAVDDADDDDDDEIEVQSGSQSGGKKEGAKSHKEQQRPKQSAAPIASTSASSNPAAIAKAGSGANLPDRGNPGGAPETPEPQKRKRGRPPGSKNKRKST